ncbi:type VI secretion protein, EvpB/ family [Piscirickettsia salmonis]|nr:type VI secretion protein, EvpB/ family [Piscirickettsia salmonis]
MQNTYRGSDAYANIKIDLLDVTKEELEEDFDCNSIDITGADLFKKVYLKEYDQFGGEPYGSMIGLYEFALRHLKCNTQ